MELKGIDVSSYHGKIKWDKVKADGIEFAIIRAGWSNTDIDPMFRKNIEEAISAGLEVGIYWYLYGKDEKDMKANAKKCNEIIMPYKKFISMGVWGVWNSDSDIYKKKYTTKLERTQLLKTFLKDMKEYGYDAGYYADSKYISKFAYYTISEYPLWLSYFATNPNPQFTSLMWQQNCHGKVDGIVPRVDIDICFGDIKNYKPSNTLDFRDTITLGSKTDRVIMIKSFLSEKGYEITDVSNLYEGSVYEAVKKFQKDNNLEVTGTVDKITWDALTGGLNG